MADAAGVLPLIVKVGGSLVVRGRHTSILHKLATARRPVVIVPGGGAFADAVRQEQALHGFDDATAHRQALGAMHRMAEQFIADADGLVIADSLDAIRDVHRSGRQPVWVPLPALENDPSIPEDWSITSDGIAARLAEMLGGADLVLLKSVDTAPCASATELAEAGVVDAAFADIVARARLAWQALGPDREHVLDRLLA